MSTLKLEVVDATYALLLEETEPRYLVTADDNTPFSYFFNPSAYGSGTVQLRYNEATNNWETLPSTAYAHDDRYSVGASYVTDFYGRPPFGSALPGVFIRTKTEGSELVSDEPNLDALKLKKIYSKATLHPVLLLKYYEPRLASYSYYTFVGKEILGEDEITAASLNAADFNVAETYFQLDKAGMMDSLANELDAEIVRMYDKFLGVDLSAKITYGPSGALDRDDPKTITVRGLASINGYETSFGGEKFGELSSGHIAKPVIALPGLTPVVGHEQHGWKAMRGVYGVFAPERLDDIAKVASDKLDTLKTAVQGSATYTGLGAQAQADLIAQLDESINERKYKWFDFFRGVDYEIEFVDGKTVRANVYLAIHGSTTTATIAFDKDGDGTFEEVVGVPVNLQDVINSETHEFSDVRPDDSRNTGATGFHSTQTVYDKDGNIIGVINDAYNL